MASIGYALSSEEHPPRDLVRYARTAEKAGFRFAMISDHYHPWISKQGHSSFVFSVLGAIAESTDQIPVGTGVTCPTMRYHPAMLAQYTATVASLMPGRFWFGVGSGEALNEHILGDHWPEAEVRLDMLREAIEVIRLLWDGEEHSFYGDYYVVENARVYDIPQELPPIYMAAAGEMALKMAGEISDGLISTTSEEGAVERFDRFGGSGKPRIGQVTVCYGEDAESAKQTFYEWWPNTALPGALHADLPTPAHFEAAVKLVKKDDMPDTAYGPDKNKHIETIQKMVDSGYEYVYIHQIGPDQEGFLRFYEEEVLPEFHS